MSIHNKTAENIYELPPALINYPIFHYTHNMKKILFIVLAMGVFFSCSNTPKNSPADKQDVSLLKGKWLLAELQGKPFIQNPQQREAFIEFDTEKMQVSGNSSCNLFGGNFTVPDPGKISFSPLRSTLMACPDMETENALYKALNDTSGFSVKNDVLTLFNADKTVLVKYKKASAS